MFTHILIIYANSTEDSANNKAPDNFPGTIGFVSDNKGKIIINSEYRSNNDKFPSLVECCQQLIQRTANLVARSVEN